MTTGGDTGFIAPNFLLKKSEVRYRSPPSLKLRRAGAMTEKRSFSVDAFLSEKRHCEDEVRSNPETKNNFVIQTNLLTYYVDNSIYIYCIIKILTLINKVEGGKHKKI